VWPPDDPEIRAALLAAWSDGTSGRYEGPHNARLCAALSELLQIDHVYPCCSGTFAVELALRMLKIGPGDEVVLAGYDFAGNFRAIEAVGATPVLVDIVPRRWHLDPQQLAAAASPQVKAVIVSHLHGALAPMAEIMRIANERGWSVVEDAAQATGAVAHGRAAGTWGHVGTFSFGGSKLLTAGRGGAVVTCDETLLQRAKVFCEQGNHAFPLSEVQAAVLLPQIAKLRQRNVQRLQAVQRIEPSFYSRAVLPAGASLQLAASPNAGDAPAYYKLGWLVNVASDSREFGGTEQLRNALVKVLQAEGIAIDAGFRGFGKRAASRCRKLGELTYSHQAAAGTLVLHHPVLLAGEAVATQLGETIARTAAGNCDSVAPIRP
jgi:dTDP-4-amino-4,6-dideoxygalactose transaminase